MVTNIEVEIEETPTGSKKYCVAFYFSGRNVPINLWIYGGQDKLSVINSILDFIKYILFYDEK